MNDQELLDRALAVLRGQLDPHSDPYPPETVAAAAAILAHADAMALRAKLDAIISEADTENYRRELAAR